MEGNAVGRVGKSFVAVLAGLLLIVLASIGTDQGLRAAGVYPPWGQPMSDALFGLATAYRIAYSIVGSYLTARLAPSRPGRHALILGLIGVVAGIAGAIATRNEGPAFGPKWYPMVIFLIPLPCAWVAVKLLEWQRPEEK